MEQTAGVGLDLFSDDYKKVDDIKDADAALVRSAAMHDMELGDKVLAVARAGAGVNNIPLDKCAEQGIVVFNTPGANANGVKELVFAGMLYASRDIVGGIDWCLANQNDENIAKTAEKQKKNFAGTEISGKKLGVIGLGAIGVLVANAAVHMGMDVYGYDPYISVNAAWNLSRSVKHISNVEDIYKNCDFITIHVPLLDSTKKMVNADAIAMIGEVKNQGVELEINSKNIVSKDFDWSTSFTLSHNKNKIVKLDGEQTQIISGSQIHMIGKSYRTFYMIEFAGINPETGAPQFYTNDVDENGN